MAKKQKDKKEAVQFSGLTNKIQQDKPTEFQYSVNHKMIVSLAMDVVHRKYNITSMRKWWDRSIDELIRQYGPERVYNLLVWFDEQDDVKYLPMIDRPRHLKKKFTRLEKVMKERNPTTKITDKAKLVVERAGLLWPDGITEDQVLAAAQQYLDEYNILAGKLKHIQATLEKERKKRIRRSNHDMLEYVSYVLAVFFQQYEIDAAVSWLRIAHSSVWYRSGDTSFEGLGLDYNKSGSFMSKLFKAWAEVFSGSAFVWFELQRLLEDTE